MAGGFKTGSQELLRAAQQMETTNAQLMNNLSQLAGEVETVASGWAGTAHNAFVQLMAKFDDDAKKLNNDLKAISEAVTGNARAYQAQEDEAQQSISAITSALG